MVNGQPAGDALLAEYVGAIGGDNDNGHGVFLQAHSA